MIQSNFCKLINCPRARMGYFINKHHSGYRCVSIENSFGFDCVYLKSNGSMREASGYFPSEYARDNITVVAACIKTFGKQCLINL